MEKLIKGLVVKNTGKEAFPIHDLRKLLKDTKIEISNKQKKEFDEITSWNITARYDTIKRAFYKKATKEFTAKWLKQVKEIYQWLLKAY